MAAITGIEKLKQVTDAWQPNEVAFINRAEWKGDERVLHLSCLCQTRTRAAWPDHLNPFYEIEITFKGVKDLGLSFSGYGPHQIVGFDIIDVSRNGWEYLNFQIEDYENGSIGFYCSEVVIDKLVALEVFM